MIPPGWQGWGGFHDSRPCTVLTLRGAQYVILLFPVTSHTQTLPCPLQPLRECAAPLHPASVETMESFRSHTAGCNSNSHNSPL